MKNNNYWLVIAMLAMNCYLQSLSTRTENLHPLDDSQQRRGHENVINEAFGARVGGEGGRAICM
eukprot:3955416-Pyramimonas_sp.AAC.1